MSFTARAAATEHETMQEMCCESGVHLRRRSKSFASRYIVIPQIETQYDKGSEMKMTSARG
jgi:hypothetical protein